MDGYRPIESYAAIGDGRTAALVSSDGSLDWLPVPDLDSPSVFAALLDGSDGGRFVLAPAMPFEARRRYVQDTNVLETTFRTSTGVVRVTDAMTLPTRGLSPMREVARRVEGLAGTVPMRWEISARFGYGAARVRARRTGVPVFDAGADALAVVHWDAGEAAYDGGRVTGRFDALTGSRALVAMSFAHEEPLVIPSRAEVEDRLDETADVWRRWAGSLEYAGDLREAVVRSALVLKLLVHAPSGAIAAAPTTSLPEWIGGERNWDYRYSWLRDASFTAAAFLALGCRPEVDAFFWWLMHASQVTRPRVQVLYRLDGGESASERTIPLGGYRGSEPVRVGNSATTQVQLDVYGHLLQTAWLHARAGSRIDRDVGRRLAETATLVSEIWKEPDSGIWEMRRDPVHFTESKMMCWVALNRATRLAAAGYLPDGDSVGWQREADAIRDFVEERCWSAERRTYVAYAGGTSLDASLLLAVPFEYRPRRPGALSSTVDAVRKELAEGSFVYRYREDDGLEDEEGAFVACSFWLVEALARTRRLDEARRVMDEALALANDVGLYAEEIDPGTGAFLGNFPQALSHLSLISAAIALQDAGT